MIPVCHLEDDEEFVSLDTLHLIGVPVLGVISRDPLAAMTRHKDTHAQAWIEPASTAKPAMAGLGTVAPLATRWPASLHA